MRHNRPSPPTKGTANALHVALLCVAAFAALLPAAAAPPSRLFPEGDPPAATVDVIDLRDASADTKLAATTLQGHVNAPPHARVYLLLRDRDAFWLDALREKSYIQNTRTLSVDAYFEKYASRCSAVVVYDPAHAVTINVATMIAGLEHAFVIAPDSLEKHGEGHRVIDLRGRWDSAADAYAWAFDELWPRMNHRILACYHPDSIPHHLRDYLVRHKVFTFWIRGGRNPEAMRERAFAEKLFAAAPVNIPVIGFWYSGKDPGINEYHGVGLAGEYGKLTLPCDWTSNLTLLSGISVDLAKCVAKYQARPARPAPPLEQDKAYLSFDILDSGDAPVYWHGVQHKVWQDPKRGSLPIAWSFAPAAAELMPSVIEWFYDRATPNDHFFMALSGAGYVHPYRNFMARTPDPEAAWRDYLALTRHYMEAFRLDTLVLYTNAWKTYDRRIHDPVTRRFTRALPQLDTLILGMGRDEGIDPAHRNYLMGGHETLVSHVITRWNAAGIGRSAANNQWLVNEIRTHTPAQRPAFVHVHALSWSYFPSDLAEVLQGLGTEYVAVSPAELKALFLLSQKKP